MLLFYKRSTSAAFDLNAMQPMEIARGGKTSALERLPAATRAHVIAAAKRYGVDANALAAVVFKESSGNPNAENRQHKGLMQLSQAIRENYGVKNWRDPQENLRAGIAYMKDMVKEAAKILNVLPEKVTTLQAYMLHQQGPFGGGGLVRSAANKETIPAWEAIQDRVSEVTRGEGISKARAQTNLRGNIPTGVKFDLEKGTAAQFLKIWENKLGSVANRPFLTPKN